jgi:EmrB/QacA subfamily drug resistance transporter
MSDTTAAAPPSRENTFPLSDDPNYKWKVLATVIFGIFMVILDTTVVNVAFQTLRNEFGGSLNDSQWIISVYVLSLGITTPLAGFLADRFGDKRIYLGGLGLFALGSLLCGLSPNLGFLIAARALQGAGGGIALPLGTALLLQAFPVAEQGMALGIFGIAALVAPAIGPILGGWLVDQNLWRVIFFINPPIGLAGVLLGLRLLRERRDDRRPAFDLAGVATEIVGFGAILYAASLAANQGWTAPGTLLWFGIGAVGLVAFGLVELFRARTPLLDLRLFTDRVFLNASLLGYVSTVALFGAEFLMPIYLQALRGRPALETGFILLPMAIRPGRPASPDGSRLRHPDGQHLAASPDPGRYHHHLDPVLAGVARHRPGPDRADHPGDRTVRRAPQGTGARLIPGQCDPPGGAVHRRGGAGDRVGQHAFP